MRLEYFTNCVSSTARFVDRQMRSAKALSKHGKWARLLVESGEWKRFEVMDDYATQLYRNAKFLIFVHSDIEYFYRIVP